MGVDLLQLFLELLSEIEDSAHLLAGFDIGELGDLSPLPVVDVGRDSSQKAELGNEKN